jgi:hypothetical protein
MRMMHHGRKVRNREDNNTMVSVKYYYRQLSYKGIQILIICVLKAAAHK